MLKYTTALSVSIFIMNCLFAEETRMQSYSDPFIHISEQRHSTRSYDPSKNITEEQIKKLVQAAHNTPSCYNDQPWTFIFCDKYKDPTAYQMVLSSLVEGNQAWAKNAPLLIVVVADTKFRHNGHDNRWGGFDTGAAAVSMMYEATSLGLNAHQMGGFDEKKIKKDFVIPAQYEPMSIMAIGYETSEEAMQSHPKKRRPIEEQFFRAEWKKGIHE